MDTLESLPILSIVTLLAVKVTPLAIKVPSELDKDVLTPFDARSFVLILRSPLPISIFASISTLYPACKVRSDEALSSASIAESTKIV